MNKQSKIRKSLTFSFWDGIFASCMTGLTNDYIAPFALALKATTSQIGLLSAIPNLAASLGQLHSPVLTDRFKSRKKVITLFVLLQALTRIPIMLIPYFFNRQPVLFLVFFVSLFMTFNAISTPAWSSLMADHIPPRSRGKYFGWRNKILSAVSICAAFSSGFVLYLNGHNVVKGFMFIFAAAFACRMVSWYFLTRMYEPVFRVNPNAYFTFWEFIRRLRYSNFAKFVLFVSCINFCVNLAAPFFSVFMLRDLKFNYLIYSVIVTTVTVTHIFTISRWGRHADRFGNLKVIRFTSLIIATLPLWWIIYQRPAYLIIIQILSGFAWSGFLLCSNNFVYDAVTPEKRTRCIAYFNTCAGAATCLGAIFGGFLANYLPAVFGFKLMALFLLSSGLRFVAVFLFTGKIKEVRSAHSITDRELLYSVIGVRPALEE